MIVDNLIECLGKQGNFLKKKIRLAMELQMKTKGIRISDIKDGKCIPLSDLLESIPDKILFVWGLLWLDVTPLQNEGKYLVTLQNTINQSENGFITSFEMLLKISEKIFQEIDLTIIASKTKEDVHRYESDQEMYETCDIVIEMIDGGCWEIFSKNIEWIDQLSKRFQCVKFLTSDFQKRESLFKNKY